MNCIHVSPTLPFDVNGIGYYAYMLGESIRNNYSISNSYISILKPILPIIPIEKKPIYLSDGSGLLSQAVRVALLDLEGPTCLIINFDIGIYDDSRNKWLSKTFRLPVFLLKSLREIKTIENLKIVIIYHEYSFTIRERREYFLRPLQKLLFKRLLRLSDFSVCSNPVVGDYLSLLNKNAKVLVHPVFSNIGEQPKLEPLLKKDDHWVIFGSSDNIIKALTSLEKDISILRDQYQVGTLYVVGGLRNIHIENLCEGLKNYISSILYLPNVHKDEVSKIFSVCRFCYMFYFGVLKADFPYLLFKSSVFAAACSHGTIPVLGHTNLESLVDFKNHPGIISKNYLGKYSSFSSKQFEQYSLSLSQWYLENSSLASLTGKFWQMIKLSCT